MDDLSPLQTLIDAHKAAMGRYAFFQAVMCPDERRRRSNASW